MSTDWKNKLYYGDNLDVLRRHVADESVDLVYLDPPFNSNANYNVLFAEKDGTKAASQIRAFDDTWTWDQEDEQVYMDMLTAGGKVADCLQAFRTFLGPCDMLAYLVMMAPRLVELRRIMKPTASIYLHCDPTASHYLKLLMDAIFGAANFRTEIVWKRSSAHSDAAQGRAQHGRIHDVILFYTKSDKWTWNCLYTPYDQEYVDTFYSNVEKGTGRRFQYGDLTAPGGAEKGNPEYEFMGVTRFWRYTREKIEALRRDGRIEFRPSGKVPRLKRYLDEAKGLPLQSVWTDIRPLTNFGNERLGYPTQKPVALLERIIESSSSPGDVVLDPFCGCGTTIAAAQKLSRRWIGVDITHLAITLMKQRLRDAFGIEAVTLGKGKATTAKVEPGDAVADEEGQYTAEVKPPGNAAAPSFSVIGEPVTLPDAEALAKSDPYQFQWWALGLVGARPVEEKKGADKGIDGKIMFQGDTPGKVETVILSVKAGHVTASHVRDLKGVLERDKAVIGVLISMEEATKPMREEAVSTGFHTSETWGKKYPRIQLLTVAQLLDGEQIDMPPIKHTFKKAEKVVKGDGYQQQKLL